MTLRRAVPTDVGGSGPASVCAGGQGPATIDAAAVVLQAASVLLDYPADEGDVQLVQAAVDELPPGARRAAVQGFLDWWRPLSAGERERVYVQTFDLGRAASLYLTEGPARGAGERGAALLALRRGYESAGMQVSRRELPDYLPLMLEVAAHAPACRPLLAAQRPALERLGASLNGGGSPFGHLLGAVLAVLPVRAAAAPAAAEWSPASAAPDRRDWPPTAARGEGAPAAGPQEAIP